MLKQTASSVAAMSVLAVALAVLGAAPVALAAPAAYFTLAPCRVLDSRLTGPELQDGTLRIVAVAGTCGVPANASAIALNITAVGSTGSGHMTVFAAGEGSTGSTVNFGVGQSRANNAVVRLSSAGELAILPVIPGAGTVHAIVDVVGYFVDDAPPTAVDDAATVAEDVPSTAVDVLANDTDTDGGLMQVGSVTQPANGAVVITGGGTGLTYQPNADACNTPPGTTLDTFTYTLTPGGSSATVTVTVTCIDDNPVAVDDAATVTEDDPATAISVLANDTDVDAGTISIASVTQPANGTVVITGGGTGVTYQPDANTCNTPPGTTLDTFTYTLTPGGDTATVSMSVTCADDNPVAVADAAAVVEDSGPNAIGVLTNDTDVDAGAISIASVTQPANGTVVITGGGAGLTYAPNPNYCNTPPGTILDTFSYTLSPGSSSTTVSVSVTCVDDGPVAVTDAATVAEDSGASAIGVLGNDPDIDGGPISIGSVTQPANGAVVITGGGTGLTYAPNLNYCNNPPGTSLDTFTYTLTPGGSMAMVSVTVTCVNDGPLVDLNGPTPAGTGFAVTFTEGDPPLLLADGVDPDAATISDVDSTTLTTLTVTLTNLLDATFEVLDANVTGFPNISKAYDATTNPLQGVLTLSTVTPQPVADFQAVLRTVTYQNTDADPDTTARSVSFVASDGTDSGAPATATVTVVAVDVPPVAVVDSATVAEDSGATAIDVLANDTDVDGGTKLVSSVTQPANGTVAITGGGTGLTYQPNPNYCNLPPGTSLDSFTYTLTPGSSSTTVTMTVTCSDDNPVAVADGATVAEDSGANAVNVLANDTDTDAGPISISSVTQPASGAVVIIGGGTGLTYAPSLNYCNTPPGTLLDTFTYTLTPGGSSTTVTMTVTCVEDNPVAVDDLATVAEDAPMTAISVLANDTDVDGGAFSVTAVTQPSNGTVVITGGGTGLSYQPSADYCNTPPGTSLDTFTYTLTPGSDTATVTVSVTCVDDNPVAVSDAATVLEDSGATAIAVLANDTDVDGGTKLVGSVTQPANGVVVITGGGSGLTYAPGPNYCNNPPGTTFDTFTYTLTPGGSSTTVTMTVTCVNDPPTLSSNPISYATAGNTQLHVAGATLVGVASIADAQSALTKASPTDIDGPVAPTVVAASGASSNGGSFAIAANGSFTYVPPAGFTGTDSFTYQVTDSVNPATGTINIAVSQVVWYVRDTVDANNPAGGDGRSTNAFETLAAAQTASGNAHTIFVFAGDTASTPLAGGIALKDGQKLHGEGIGLSVPGFANIVAAGSQPKINNAVGDAVTVPATSGNRNLVEIRGLDLQASGNAVDVTASGANAVGITISDNTLSGAGLEGIDLNAGSTGLFTATVQNNAIVSTGNGFDARTSAAGLLQVSLNSNVVASSSNGIVVDGSGGGLTHITGFANNSVSGVALGTGIAVTSATFDATPGGAYQTVLGGNTTVGASGNGVGTNGIVLTNVSGDLAFADLDVFADGGAAVRASGTAPFTGSAGLQLAVGAGVSVLSAVGGPAVDLTTVTASLPLLQVGSTNSASTGVSLVTVPGTFSAGASSFISSATGTDFVVSGANATVTYAGTITDDVGPLVQVTNTTGGTKTFSGAITDGNDGDGSGISLTTNTGATINFQGGLLLSTGANPAFVATGGGTVNVCDENPCNPSATGLLVNTLTTTTATALNVANTTIGASGLEFRAISANGATSGIILNTTGALGGLSVKGSGAAGSGGTIQNSTGPGISLSSTNGVNLARMSIQNGGDDGIRGTGVTGFTLAFSTVSGNGNALGESGIDFGDGGGPYASGFIGLVGAGSVTSTAVSANYHNGILVRNKDTAAPFDQLNLTIGGAGCSVTGSTDNNNDDGILIESGESSVMQVSVTGCTFSSNKGDHFQAAALNSGSIGVTFASNTLTGGHPTALGQGITINVATGVPGYLGSVTYDVDGNTINGAISNAISVVQGTSAASAGMTGRIRNNTIGTSGVALSCSTQANGVYVDARGNGTHTSQVSNNVIRQCFDRGILSEAGDGDSTLNLTVTGNTIDQQVAAGAREAIQTNHGITSTNVFGNVDSNVVCLQLGGPGPLANTFSHGAGAPDDFRLRKRQEATVRLPGYAGGTGQDAGSLAQVVAFIQGQNTGSGGEPGSAAASGAGGGYTGGSACPLP